MKKILAVLLAVLVAFSALAVSVMAAEAEEPTVAVEAETEEELVQPENFVQLFLAVVFKAFEKVISTFMSLFEGFGVDLDSILSDGIGNLFGAAEETTAAAVVF